MKNSCIKKNKSKKNLQLPSVRSLNIVIRKSHDTEISKANKALAFRLITKPSSLSFQEFEENFIKHKYIKYMLNRTKKNSFSQNRIPPCDIYNQTSSNFNFKVEKSIGNHWFNIKGSNKK